MRRVVLVLAVFAIPLAAWAQVRVEGERPACVRVEASARFGAMAYDHWVHLENGCDRAVRCRVRTDVNPEVSTVALEPGARRDVATFHGSPASVFVATVDCE
jgi:hypothetical protein